MLMTIGRLSSESGLVLVIFTCRSLSLSLSFYFYFCCCCGSIGFLDPLRFVLYIYIYIHTYVRTYLGLHRSIRTYLSIYLSIHSSSSPPSPKKKKKLGAAKFAGLRNVPSGKSSFERDARKVSCVLPSSKGGRPQPDRLGASVHLPSPLVGLDPILLGLRTYGCTYFILHPPPLSLSLSRKAGTLMGRYAVGAQQANRGPGGL